MLADRVVIFGLRGSQPVLFTQFTKVLCGLYNILQSTRLINKDSVFFTVVSSRYFSERSPA